MSTKRKGKQLEYVEVVVGLEPGFFTTYEEHLNEQNPLVFSKNFISDAELDANKLKEKLPTLINALDLKGKVSIYIKKQWSDEEED